MPYFNESQLEKSIIALLQEQGIYEEGTTNMAAEDPVEYK